MIKKTNILELLIEPTHKNFKYFFNEFHPYYYDMTGNFFNEFHPYYYDMTGNNIPCYKEYMRLIECLKNNKNEKKLMCKIKYYDLINCLKKNGLNNNE